MKICYDGEKYYNLGKRQMKAYGTALEVGSINAYVDLNTE